MYQKAEQLQQEIKYFAVANRIKLTNDGQDQTILWQARKLKKELHRRN